MRSSGQSRETCHAQLTDYNPPAMTSRFRGGEIYGIPIPTVFDENNAIRCAGCGEPIDGTPFRITILDIVAPEAPRRASG
jgi:hypothetical protein